MPKSGKPTQPVKAAPRVAGIIATNMASLIAMAERNPELADRKTPVLIEAYTKARIEEFGDSVSKSNIYRMLKGSRAVGADVLDVVARTFGLEAWHMLVEGMDPVNAPVILRSEAERRLHQQIQASWRAIPPSEANNVPKEGAAGTDDSGSDPARTASGRGDTRTGETRSAATPAKGTHGKA